MEFPLEGLNIHFKGLGSEQSIVGGADKFLKDLKRETKGLVLQLIEKGTEKKALTAGWQVLQIWINTKMFLRSPWANP